MRADEGDRSLSLSVRPIASRAYAVAWSSVSVVPLCAWVVDPGGVELTTDSEGRAFAERGLRVGVADAGSECVDRTVEHDGDVGLDSEVPLDEVRRPGR